MLSKTLNKNGYGVQSKPPHALVDICDTAFQTVPGRAVPGAERWRM